MINVTIATLSRNTTAGEHIPNRTHTADGAQIMKYSDVPVLDVQSPVEVLTIVCLLCHGASLLVAKDEVDPVMEMVGDIVTL